MTDLVQQASYQLGLPNQEYLRQAQQVNQANQQMASGFEQLAAEETQVTQTTQMVGNEFAKLEGRYDRLIAIENRRRNALEQSTRVAMEEGVSAERLAAHIGRVNARFDDQVAALNRVRGPMGQVAASSNAMGRSVQNAAFQFGDLFVQLASGQGIMRPLIQQGTQFVSAFGPWGAILGAAGAAFGALVMSMGGFEDSTKSAEAAQEAFNKKLERAAQLTKQFREEMRMTTEARAAEARYEVRDLEAMLKKRQGSFAEMQKQLEDAAGEFMSRTGMDRATALQQAEDALFGGTEQVTAKDGSVSTPSLFQRERDAIRDLRADILKLRAEYGEFDKFNGPEMMRTRLTGDPFQPTASNDNKTTGARPTQTRAIEEQSSALSELFHLQEREARLMGLTQRARAVETATIQAQAAAQRDYAAGLRDSPLMTGEELARVQELTAANYDLSHAETERGIKAVKINEEISESTRLLEGFIDQSFDRIGGGITEALATGQIEMAKLGDIGRAVVSELMQLFMQLAITNPLKNLALGQDNPVLSDVVGSIFSGIGNWFGGGLMADPNGAMLGRAGGGPVKRGQTYWVGEAGPEPFTPAEDGYITPNWQAMRGANSNAPVINIIDQRSAGTSEPVETQQRQGPGGEIQYDIIIKDRLTQMVDRGQLDGVLGRRFNQTAIPAVRRG